jgi:hypothetical protein
VPTEDTQRLRDAIARWRSDLEALNKREAEQDPSLQVERRALEIAIKALDLCIGRKVVPRLEGPDAFITEVVIPTREHSIAVTEMSRHSHGPVVVECELFCSSVLAALDLVSEALRASEHVPGWAPLYIRLWRELLRGS